jgi:chemotaxis protein CheX
MIRWLSADGVGKRDCHLNIMSSPTLPLDVNQFMVGHLVDVFSTMLSLTAVPAEATDALKEGDRVTGSVGFAGESIQGVVYLHMADVFARRVAGAMLGLAPEEISGPEEMDDVVGEVTNMLAGGLKSAFCDAGRKCALSPPAIIRGSSYSIKPLPNLDRFWMVFACENERLAVEIHLRLI